MQKQRCRLATIKVICSWSSEVSLFMLHFTISLYVVMCYLEHDEENTCTFHFFITANSIRKCFLNVIDAWKKCQMKYSTF